MANAVRYIAIVDDHALFRKGLAALIQYIPGYKVLYEASNGKDFIRRLNPSQLPDIVLLDIRMPEMDGYATAEWIHTNQPTIAVLALSTMDSETAIIKMIKCGAKGYLLKDTEPDELRRALDGVLNNGYFYNDLMTQKILRSMEKLACAHSSSGLSHLNDRETEFLKWVCTEKSYAEIAEVMFLSPRTIDGYREALFEKLQVKSRIGLALYAIKNEIVHL